MTRLVTLRVVIPSDDAVRVDQVQKFLQDLLRAQPNAVVPLAAKGEGDLIQPDSGTIFPCAADVLQGLTAVKPAAGRRASA